MFLESIDYSQFERTPKAWKLENCTFGNINLIVGKNATGKSRTLNIIGGLADLFCGYHKMTYLSGNYNVRFENDGKKIDYILKYKNNCVLITYFIGYRKKEDFKNLFRNYFKYHFFDDWFFCITLIIIPANEVWFLFFCLKIQEG